MGYVLPSKAHDFRMGYIGGLMIFDALADATTTSTGWNSVTRRGTGNSERSNRITLIMTRRKRESSSAAMQSTSVAN